MCHQGFLSMVAPSRGRGLKLTLSEKLVPVGPSRPFAGAWIETVSRIADPVWHQVAPSRGRGLKPRRHQQVLMTAVVAPSRGRGLKHAGGTQVGPTIAGRPFAGAWIETASSAHKKDPPVVAPSRGRGLK